MWFGQSPFSLSLLQDGRSLRARQVQELLQAIQGRHQLPQDQVRLYLLNSLLKQKEEEHQGLHDLTQLEN